jgi:hypothetical protein|tara:strand:+ start:2275 stop:2634 length:360 start_codon:yes stop_codon:yes gene_type:complete
MKTINLLEEKDLKGLMLKVAKLESEVKNLREENILLFDEVTDLGNKVKLNHDFFISMSEQLLGELERQKTGLSNFLRENKTNLYERGFKRKAQELATMSRSNGQHLRHIINNLQKNTPH